MFKKSFLICAIAASYALATSLPRYYSPTFFMPYKHPGLAAKPARALAKTAALEWKKVTSTQYSNVNLTGSAVIWAFSSRDTVVYDALGNMVVAKTSSSHSGWSQDSLQSFDSCVYVNGELAEEIQEYFDYYFGVREMYGYRDTYTELDSGKVGVSIHYDWNNAKKIWKPSYKDSIIVSAPFTDFNTGDFSNLVQEVFLSYDTSTGAWKTTGNMARIDSECTANIFVIAGKTLMDGSDSLSNVKVIMTFASQVKAMQNMIEESVQYTDSVTGKYYDVYRFLYTFDKNGFPTSQQSLAWDSLTKRLENSHMDLMFPDAHGNDTLEFRCDYSSAAGSWDTTIGKRYTRLYDAYGNNVSTVASYLNISDHTWKVQDKDSVVYSQIISPVLHETTPAFSKEIVIKKTLTSIRFSGNGICGLRLYDMAGRLVVSMSQKPGPFIELGLAAHKSSIRSGKYIARVKIGAREMSFKVPVLR